MYLRNLGHPKTVDNNRISSYQSVPYFIQSKASAVMSPCPIDLIYYFLIGLSSLTTFIMNARRCG